MDPKRTALVLIEYQNDFTSKGGTLHDAVKGVMENNNMLQNTIDTVKKAREAGCTIVYAPITFVEGYGELSDQPYGILKGVVDSKSFRKGTGAPRSWTFSSRSQATSSSKANAGCVALPARISISSFEAAASTRSRSEAF